jgi:hypothetical protein
MASARDHERSLRTRRNRPDPNFCLENPNKSTGIKVENVEHVALMSNEEMQQLLQWVERKL